MHPDLTILLNNDLVEGAGAELPDVPKLITARIAAAAAVTARSTAVVPRADAAIEAATTAIIDGAGLPETFDADVWQAQNAGQISAAGLRGAAEVQNRLDDRLLAALQAGTATILDRLDEKLRTVVDRGRELDLGGASDAEEAITLGVTEAWTELTRAREEYHLIRGSQALVMQILAPGAEAMPDSFGYVENVVELWPEWYLYAGIRAVWATIDGDPIHTTPPWPTDPGHRFGWLVENTDARPWVPTVAKLAAAVARARRDAAEADQPSAGSARVARAREAAHDRMAGAMKVQSDWEQMTRAAMR